MVGYLRHREQWGARPVGWASIATRCDTRITPVATLGSDLDDPDVSAELWLLLRY